MIYSEKVDLLHVLTSLMCFYLHCGIHSVSRLAPPCRWSFILHWPMTKLQFVHYMFRFTDIWHINLWKTSNVHFSQTNCSISFKLTAFITDTHRCQHINFQSNWLSFRNFIKYWKEWHIFILWASLTMEQLEILRYFNSKCENELGLVPKYMDFALFPLAHEYWLTSLVFHYFGSEGMSG